ncbi:major royal jelly protein 1-like [Athalia rosae]|uniref:major royal jelly protein 1-like n=1 Tax=Athalia rosae TaxID=37344 RepID=UPI0020336A2C|nr:major royal jelly protein 1-like [Athalia rosae]
MKSQTIQTLSILLASATFCMGGLDVLYEWKYIAYEWDNPYDESSSRSDGRYDRKRIVPNDVQQLSDGRVLVTTPKYYDNPASLSIVSSRSENGGPLLAPYPSWDWHKKSGDCSGITSVNRVRVDRCNRLWVVDSGKIGDEQVCPAKILTFDPTTDELLDTFEIPTELTYNPDDPSQGRVEIQVVETIGDNCEQTWAYIGDPEGFGLLIYNGTSIWRLNDKIFAPEAEQTNFVIDNESVRLDIGVGSMLLPPSGFVEEQPVLFKPLASVKGYAATREQMHYSYSGIDIQYYMCNYTIPSQELARDYSSDGVLIAGFPLQTAIACWNLQYPLVDPYVEILDQDSEKLQFVSGLKITKGIQNGVEGENVWVMTNRYQKFRLGSLDFSDVNFRILGSNVADLVKGTYCETKSHELVPTMEEKFFFKIEN